MTGKYFVVDAQFHNIPLEVAKEAFKKAEPSEEKDFLFQIDKANISDRRLFDTKAAVSHMEECGIDMAVVFRAIWSHIGLGFCKTLNDGLAKLMREYPGKFIPLAHIPYLEGQPALDELERAINFLGLKGVAVTTSHRDIRLDDQQLKPFFKKVSQLRVPVVVHPTIGKAIWGGEKYYMSGSVSREYEIIKAFVEVLSGVLPEFPELNFIFAHYGGGVPFLKGRIMSWYTPENFNIPEELKGKPKTIKEFEDYGLKKDFDKLFAQIYFDMAGTGGWMPAVRQALLAIKPDRLCFASDYPHEMDRAADLNAYISGIKELDISEKDRGKILGGNIMALFK
jgi:predicted TIM-barrel fold metal-dependent hydrolase